MSKKKIFNDPVYGFITFPYDILYDLIDHPYFQRLRRVTQQGMSHVVYPGAMHTRFHHALGALHLTCRAISNLRSKGVDITEAEAEGTCIAILLHDVGHGPYSHALERTLLPYHHERMSLAIMRKLDQEFDGRLSTGIEIFEGRYHKKYLHQIVSSQLDMDRLDYLTRDSFYTGVAEGVVGYDRIIMMLNVKDNMLVVEEKGIYSIEKFLIARRFMYWQVYLHKTGIAAEQMLISFMRRLRDLHSLGKEVKMSTQLYNVLNISMLEPNNISNSTIDLFCQLDDADIQYTMKIQGESEDRVLQYLSRSLLDRNLFSIKLENNEIEESRRKSITEKVSEKLGFSTEECQYLVLQGSEKHQIYNDVSEKIHILGKNGNIYPIEEISDNGISSKSIVKYYICHPKLHI